MSEFYPTPLAGQRITADLLRSMLPVTARKTGDTTRSATTTPAADPHLQFEVVADATYIIDGWIKYDSPIAADIIFDFSTPSGALGEWVGYGTGHSPVISTNSGGTVTLDTVSSRGYLIRTGSNDIAAALSYGGLGVGTSMVVLINATLRTVGTAGTYSFDWAQNTSDAGSTTVYSDSWLRMQRTA
jgi:hypothetical protein